MLPPVIYGLNPKYGRLSIQMPTLIRFAIAKGYAGHVGKGASVWNAVHVFDLARAYLILLHWLEKSPAAMVLENPYFFCENGTEFAWEEAAAVIGKALHASGKIAAPDPRPIPDSDFDSLFGNPATGIVVGSNSRCRANRLRELGWMPEEKGLFDSLVEDEIPVIMQEAGGFQGYARRAA